jgi:hypothetical protein
VLSFYCCSMNCKQMQSLHFVLDFVCYLVFNELSIGCLALGELTGFAIQQSFTTLQLLTKVNCNLQPFFVLFSGSRFFCFSLCVCVFMFKLQWLKRSVILLKVWRELMKILHQLPFFICRLPLFICHFHHSQMLKCANS